MCNIIEFLMKVREKLAKLPRVTSSIYMKQSDSRGHPEGGRHRRRNTDDATVLEDAGVEDDPGGELNLLRPFSSLQGTARAIPAQSRIGGYLGCTDGSPVGQEFVSRLGLPSNRCPAFRSSVPKGTFLQNEISCSVKL